MSPGDTVRATEELSWLHGNGVVIHRGESVELLWSFTSRDGLRRWAVRTAWGVVAHSIPEQLLEAVE